MDEDDIENDVDEDTASGGTLPSPDEEPPAVHRMSDEDITARFSDLSGSIDRVQAALDKLDMTVRTMGHSPDPEPPARKTTISDLFE